MLVFFIEIFFSYIKDLIYYISETKCIFIIQIENISEFSNKHIYIYLIYHFKQDFFYLRFSKGTFDQICINLTPNYLELRTFKNLKKYFLNIHKLCCYDASKSSL